MNEFIITVGVAICLCVLGALALAAWELVLRCLPGRRRRETGLRDLEAQSEAWARGNGRDAGDREKGLR